MVALAELMEKELEEQAVLRSRMIRSVSSIMNVDTLNSIEQVGSALTAIAGEGNGVDNEGKVGVTATDNSGNHRRTPQSRPTPSSFPSPAVAVRQPTVP